MEKRFELFEEELEYWIHDHDTKKNFGNWDLDHLTDLLNKQDEKIKNQEKIIENGNQRLIDKYFEELNKLDEACNTDLDERLKEIEKLKQENQQLTKLYDQLNKKYCEEMDKNIILKQSQNSKAIEVLERLRNFYDLESNSDWVITCCELDGYINNQITKLRGEEND